MATVESSSTDPALQWRCANMTGAVPGIRLNNGVDIPQVGFGVFRLPDDTATERVVLTVIECGYGSIDTAALYGNEVGVGRAVETCGLTRDELFVTTRLAVGPPLQLGGRLRP